MPRLNEATRRRRRDDIASAAMRCFLRSGFIDTSMADIIREAGSSSGSVYANFQDKSELTRYAAARELDALTASATRDLPDQRTPATVLRHLLSTAGTRDHARMMLQIWAEVPRDDQLGEIARSSRQDLHDLVQEALLPWCREQRSRAQSPMSDADLEQQAAQLAETLLSLMHGCLVRLTVDPGADPETIAAQTAAIVSRL